jgi:hypothetical protein
VFFRVVTVIPDWFIQRGTVLFYIGIGTGEKVFKINQLRL